MSIIVTKTGVRITPYKRKESSLLENITSYYDPSVRRPKPMVGYYIPKKTFVTYDMQPEYIQSLLPKHEIKYDVPINTVPINKFKLNNNIQLTDIQYKTVETCLQKDDKHKIYINMQTGRGKTFVGLYLMAHYNMKSIVICYKTNVLQQWIDSLNDSNFYETGNKVLLLKSSSMLMKIITNVIDVSEYSLFLTTPNLLASFAKNNSWDLVSELFRKLNIGVKIYDEAHRNIKSMVCIDAYTNVNKNFYLSAEFQQTTDEKSKLFYKMFWSTPIINVEPELHQNNLHYVDICTITYNSRPSDTDEMKVYSNRGFSNINYMKYQYTKKYLYTSLDIIIDSIYKYKFNHGYKTLIMTYLVDGVETIYDYIKDKYSDNYKIGKFHASLSDEEKEYALNEADIIIATYSSFSIGIDCKNIQFVVTCDQIDLLTDNQSAGRARPIQGRRAVYYMLIDDGFKRSRKSKAKRIEYLYKSKASRVINFTLKEEI